MPARRTRSNAERRFHTVLIPGFAGFDALGQLEYYGGLTELFANVRRHNEVLHYFDNFPTAAVGTRARLLREYLAKRMARGEISNDDDVTLIGHSTGGLDIRMLLWDLKELLEAERVIPADSVEVDPGKLLKRIHRVVFLSVPHLGTNIADWVRSHFVLRKGFIENLRGAVRGSHLSPVERVESGIATSTASLTGAPLYDAVRDALDEANEDNGEHSAYRRAKAHEAASELGLYLRQMASDFRAIDDLTCRPPSDSKTNRQSTTSPAHFSPQDRTKEQERFRGADKAGEIEFQSYVTLGKRPFAFDLGSPAPLWELTDPCTYPEVCKDAAASERTDWVYRACYRACAGGPFNPPNESRELAERVSPKESIEVWDNDGIVNTLSMFWPLGKNVLVHADHMDIVGQYRPLPANPRTGRKGSTYDLLRSDSEFNEELFNNIWMDIFTFALGRRLARRRAAKTAN